MTQSGKLINGGLALILISSSGCAGNGLRNMFSRNETAGYKTLEELEEERLAKEESGDESGSRFASWLPFGKKAAEDTEAVADADDSVNESKEGKTTGWWKNPFRRQETIEADPFLENELPTDVIVAGKNDVKAKADEAASAAGAKTSKDIAAVKDQAVKKVSATTEAAEAEDDLLVEKFEKHFQQTTEAAVTTAEKSSDVIVAGVEGAAAGTAASKKKVESSAESVNVAADKKLAEFEELLAKKKSAASKAKEEVIPEEGIESVADAADEFAESLAATSKSTAKQGRATGKQAVAAVDEFDSLFEPVEKPVAPKKKKSESTRSSSAVKNTDDVSVARAEDIFGAKAVSGNGSRQAKKSASSGGWKSEESEADVASTAGAENVGSGQETDLARKVIDKTVDQFAAMFSGSRNAGGAPAAKAPDADEWTAASQGRSNADGRQAVPIRMASTGRELGPALDTPARLKDDRFFTGGGNAPSVTNLQAVPTEEVNVPSAPAAPIIREKADSKATGPAVKLPSTFTFRNMVLVIGGIIVAALLFAPGRKKPTVANQLPVQG
ncbi:MAG: hypothetical protein U0936_14485 [Planctomycetaceae bacterium]